MAENKMVEVRFDCGLHDLKEEQALGLLRGLEKYDPIVGLGFENKAAVILNTDDSIGGLRDAISLSAKFGLVIACSQTMTEEEYEKAAWDEVDLDEQ